MPIHTNLRLNVRVQAPKEEGAQPRVAIVPAPRELAIEGPILDILVGVTDSHAKLLEDNNQQVPQPIPGKAVIDTGASISAIAVNALEQLGVAPIGAARIYTPQGTDLEELYPAKMSFPGTGLQSVQTLTAIGSPAIGKQKLIALLGRDVLAHWLFIYNGSSGNITVAS